MISLAQPADSSESESSATNVQAANRLILLGASNLARGYRTISALLTSRLREPSEVVFALGHGRSYGKVTRVMKRGLPSIKDCGLWEHIADWTEQPAPAALITDIGNDLMYEVPVPTILDWVRECLGRLRDVGAEITMTLPPRERVIAVPRWQYYPIRTVLYPKRRMTWEEMRSGMERLLDGVRELADEFGVHLIDPPRHWYGFDPIHIRGGAMIEAWTHILSRWTDNVSWDVTQPWPNACRLDPFPRPRPRQYTLWGRERSAAQPFIQTDRLTMSFY